MPKTSPPQKKERPAAFRQYNETTSERTVRLTRQAIAALQAGKRTVTLAAIAETSRAVDATGQSLTPTTILRNPEAAQLFRQHSPAYQAKQQARLAHPQPTIEAQIPITYRGLSSAELVRLIEALKKQVTDLKTQRDQLKVERDEAYRLRDEALQQNTRQLAALTRLMSRTEETKD